VRVGSAAGSREGAGRDGDMAGLIAKYLAGDMVFVCYIGWGVGNVIPHNLPRLSHKLESRDWIVIGGLIISYMF
jgi:hypothetical protein